MYNQKPYKKYLIITTPIEGDCWRSEVKNKNSEVVFDTYWQAPRLGVPATQENSIKWAEAWVDTLED